MASATVDGGGHTPVLVEADAALASAWALKQQCYATWTSEPQRAAQAADALQQLARDWPQLAEVQALAHWTAGVVRLNLGRMADAVAQLDAAAALWKQLGRPLEAAKTQVPKVMALSMLGQHDQAVACGAEASRVFLQLGDLAAASRLNLNLGSMHMRRDDHADAARHYRQAAVLFARARDTEHSVMADIGLGDALTAQADFAEAARIYSRARMRAGQHGLPLMQALADESMALLDLARGGYDAALAGLERARRSCDRLQLPQQLAIAEKQLADAYLALRLLPEALALYDGCLAGLGAAVPALAGTAGGNLPGELMLVLRSPGDLLALQARYSFSLAGRFGARPIDRIALPAGSDVNATSAALAAEPGVLVAEPNLRRGAPESVKNNVWTIGTAQAYAAQWAGEAINLDKAQAQASGQGVTVAVLDTGVDVSHPALAGRLLPGWDFVDGDAGPSEAAATGAGHGHGTHVAGLVAWVAPGAKILPLRVLDAEGQGNAWVLAEAMLRAIDPDGNPATADGAQVINLSLAGLQDSKLMRTIDKLVNCALIVPGDPPDPLVDTSDAGYDADRQRCGVQGGTLVAAGAGNDGSSTLRTWPAAESAYSLLAVAASNPQGRLASFSNSGNWIALAAPGDQVTSTVPGGGYATWSGTSMATPLVACAAALLRERFPLLPAKDVARCLVASGGKLSGARQVQLDVGRAMGLLASDPKRCR